MIAASVVEYRVWLVELGSPCQGGGNNNGIHSDYDEAAAHVKRWHSVGRVEIQSRTTTVTEWTRETP